MIVAAHVSARYLAQDPAAIGGKCLFWLGSNRHGRRCYIAIPRATRGRAHDRCLQRASTRPAQQAGSYLDGARSARSCNRDHWPHAPGSTPCGRAGFFLGNWVGGQRTVSATGGLRHDGSELAVSASIVEYTDVVGTADFPLRGALAGCFRVADAHNDGDTVNYHATDGSNVEIEGD
jgi:hypothetical protein